VSLLPLGGFSLLGPVRGPNRRTSCFHLAFQPCFRNASPSTSGVSPHASPFTCWWYYPLCRADPLLGLPAHEHPSRSNRRLGYLFGPTGDRTATAEAVTVSSPRDPATPRPVLFPGHPALVASGRSQKQTPQSVPGNSEPLGGKPGPQLSLMDPAATVPLRHGEITAQAEASVMVCTPRRAVTDPLPVLLANNGQLAATGSSGACCPPWLRPKPKPVLAVEHHRATHVGLPESVAGSGWLPWVARGPLPASRRSPV
jgi:hypothetical protein